MRNRSLLALTVGTCWLMAVSPVARGNIFRWDNGQLIPGTEGITPGPGVQLDHRDLQFAALSGLNLSDARFDFSDLAWADFHQAALTGANLNHANLAGASFIQATLTGANLADAFVRGAAFNGTTSRGFAKEQLYSTASYQARNLGDIAMAANNLSGWNLAGQNLVGASFLGATLTATDLSRADLRGATFDFSHGTPASNNAILADGCIASLNLAGGEGLVAFPDVAIPVRVAAPFSIDPAARLDLTNNALIVAAAGGPSPYSQVATLLASGAAGLAWNGPGISSSTAAGDPHQLTAVGMMLNDNGLGGPYYTTFAGQPVDAGSVLAKFTYYGDADLSGVVDGTDYALIDNGFNAVLSGWFNGDFDYSGLIDGTDYALIDNAFNSQGAPLGWGNVAAVPEPSGWLLLSVGSPLLLRAAGFGRTSRRPSN